MFAVPWKHLLILLLGAIMSTPAEGSYNVAAYCTLVKPGTMLPSIDSCQDFYICTSDGYTEGSCQSDYSFDKDKQKCLPSSETKCYYGLDEPCDGTSEGHVPQVGTCNGWIYCKDNVEIGRGNCPTGMIFKDGICDYGDCPDDSAEETVIQICDIMPTGIYFGNTIDCAQYQICKADSNEPEGGDCHDNNMVFDVQLGLCNYESATDCSRVTGVEIPGLTVKCDSSGTKKPNKNVCSAYYECDGTKYVEMSCKTGEYYDIVSKGCESRQSAKPSPKCNRCEGTKNQFVNSVYPGCSGYLICSNGNNVGSGKCTTNETGKIAYFNEQFQACMITDSGKNNEYLTDNEACSINCGTWKGSNCEGTDSDLLCGYNGTGDKCEICTDGVGADNKCISE